MKTLNLHANPTLWQGIAFRIQMIVVMRKHPNRCCGPKTGFAIETTSTKSTKKHRPTKTSIGHRPTLSWSLDSFAVIGITISPDVRHEFVTLKLFFIKIIIQQNDVDGSVEPGATTKMKNNSPARENDLFERWVIILAFSRLAIPRSDCAYPSTNATRRRLKAFDL
jgi:hypothetical protein